jgi:hypothetical protein
VIDLHEYDAHVWAVGQQRIKVIAALAATEKTDKASIEAAAILTTKQSQAGLLEDPR